MPELDLDAIEARTNAATPGPWRREDHKPNLTRYVLSEDDTLDISFGYVGNRTEDNAEFVAHARTDVPLLVDVARRVKRIRGDISRALALIDEFDGPEVSTAEHAKWVEVRNALGGEV